MGSLILRHPWKTIFRGKLNPSHRLGGSDTKPGIRFLAVAGQAQTQLGLSLRLTELFAINFSLKFGGLYLLKIANFHTAL